MHNHTERLLPILTYIQAHLEQELSLETLAEKAGLSDFHFHRLFRAAVGETAKRYVQRLRLERAAYQLKIQDIAVIDVAFGLGYNTHETFTRAFHKQFGISPQEYRQRYHIEKLLATRQRGMAEQPQLLNQNVTQVEISTVRICRLDPIPVAFIRHLGAYTEVDVTAFDTLIAWAQRRNLYRGDNLLIGIGHDDPTITPTEKVRFDACLSLDQAFTAADGDLTGAIGFQTIAAGAYATVTYVGPYGATLEQAYRAIFYRLYNDPNYTIIGLPAVEIYRTTRINPDYALNHTDVYVPIVVHRG